VDLGDVTWQGWDRAEGDKAEAPKDRRNPLVPRDDEYDAGSDLEHPAGDDGERYEGCGKRDTADAFSVLYVTAPWSGPYQVRHGRDSRASVTTVASGPWA
jgi:hypothetical protein